VEAVVGDSVERVFVRVDGHVTLGRVEHVGHPDPPEIVHVLDGVPVAQDHSGVHPVAVDPDGSTLVPVSRSQHAWHDPVFRGPCVDNRVDELIPGPLHSASDTGRL